MSFAPLLPLWAVLLCALAGAAALVAVYRRPSLPAALRLATLAGLTLLLANPVRTRQAEVATTPLLAVVADCSGSMARTDGPDGLTRGAAARAAAARLAQQLAGRWRVTVTGFSGTLASPLPGDDRGDSDFAALAGLAGLTPRPVAAVVISDGADWAGSDPETTLAAAKVVVHTVGVGSAVTGANATVDLTVPSPQLSPGQEVPLTVEVGATPELAGRSAELVVEQIDDPQHPQELLRTTVTLGAWQQLAITAKAGDALGGRLWQARLAAQPGEVSTIDNTATATAQVVDRTLRVLVLEGRPCWDTTFAVRAWRRDRQIEISTAYAVGKATWQAGPAVVPPTVDSLANCDVLVLGQAVDGLLPEPAVLRTWVDGGGRLLLLGTGALPGLEEFDPLAPTADPQPVTVAGGDADGLLPTAARLPALSAPATLAPQARVLLGSREQPLIALRRLAGGAVCRVDIDGFWRWHFREAAAETAGRAVSERFCRQLLRSLARTPAGELWAERLRLPVGESAALWTRPDTGIASVLHTLPDGTTRILALHDNGVRPRLDQPGLHRFSAGTRQVAVVAEQRLGELVSVARDDQRLQRLAQRTGGEMVDLARIDELAARLTAQRVLSGSVVRSAPVIGERWWLLTLAGLLAAEWWIRRRHHGVT